MTYEELKFTNNSTYDLSEEINDDILKKRFNDVLFIVVRDYDCPDISLNKTFLLQRRKNGEHSTDMAYKKLGVYNTNELAGLLFEYSLSKRIVLWKKNIIDQDYGLRNNNPKLFAYEFVVCESPDHDTNITPEFIERLVSIYNVGLGET